MSTLTLIDGEDRQLAVSPVELSLLLCQILPSVLGPVLTN